MQIVFEGKTKKGLPLLIRYSTPEDLEAMWAYINALSQERTHVMYQGENVSLKEEKEFLHGQLKKIKKHQAVLLLVFTGNQLIGVSGIEMKDRVAKHEGVFGLSITKEYRKQGIGSLLMKSVLKEALKHIPQLRIVTLGVFANNHIAINMYKKFGFSISGKIPKGILYKNQYHDHIFMYKFVRDF